MLITGIVCLKLHHVNTWTIAAHCTILVSLYETCVVTAMSPASVAAGLAENADVPHNRTPAAVFVGQVK